MLCPAWICQLCGLHFTLTGAGGLTQHSCQCEIEIWGVGCLVARGVKFDFQRRMMQTRVNENGSGSYIIVTQAVIIFPGLAAMRDGYSGKKTNPVLPRRLTLAAGLYKSNTNPYKIQAPSLWRNAPSSTLSDSSPRNPTERPCLTCGKTADLLT